MWIKNKNNWQKITKKSVNYSSPSVIRKKREAFERKKLTKAFRVWRYKQYKEIQGSLCYYCHNPIKGAWVTDHVVPLSRGGTSKYSNLVVTCWDCNKKKNVRYTKLSAD